MNSHLSSGSPAGYDAPGPPPRPCEDTANGGATLPGRVGWIETWRRQARQIKQETYAIYLACRDARTPWYAKVFAALVVGYAFSPIDLIPDFIPVLGYLDDLLLVPLGILMTLKMIPPPVMAECRERARLATASAGPANWTAAAVIVAIWLAVAALAAILVLRAIRQ